MSVLKVNSAFLVQSLTFGAFIIKESLHKNAKENYYIWEYLTLKRRLIGENNIEI